MLLTWYTTPRSLHKQASRSFYSRSKGGEVRRSMRSIVSFVEFLVCGFRSLEFVISTSWKMSSISTYINWSGIYKHRVITNAKDSNYLFKHFSYEITTTFITLKYDASNKTESQRYLSRYWEGCGQPRKMRRRTEVQKCSTATNSRREPYQGTEACYLESLDSF